MARYSLVWTPTAEDVQEHTVTVVVDDGKGGVDEQSFVLDVRPSSARRDPQIISTPRTSARLGREYFYLVEATDSAGDPLTYSLSTHPDGMSINEVGLLSWVPSNDQIGNHAVELLVQDGRGGSRSQAYEITVGSQDVNSAPTIVSIPQLTAALDRGFAYDIVARDVDGDPLRYSLLSAPRGMSIDTLRGTVRWTPDDQQLGQHAVVVEVQDPLLDTSTQRFVVEVRCGNTHPLITSVPPTRAYTNQTYRYPVRAEDLDGADLTYALVSGPSEMEISDSGILLWQPTTQQVDSHAVEIQVVDSFGAIGSQRFNVVVSAADELMDPSDPTSTNVGSRPPVITSTPIFKAETDTLYRYQVAAADPEGDSLNFDFIMSPEGMTIDRSSGRIDWQPDSTMVGEHPVTIVVEDSGNAVATQSYLVTVSINQPPSILSTAPVSISAGEIYRHAVRATDPDDDPISFTLDESPDGMTINSSGLIVWPTTAELTGSSHAVRIIVSDDHGQSDAQEFTVQVVPDLEPPSVTVLAGIDAFSLGSELTVDIGNEFVLLSHATDNVDDDLEFLRLTAGGIDLSLDDNGQARYMPPGIGPVECCCHGSRCRRQRRYTIDDGGSR